jgi:hypothetical protein
MTLAVDFLEALLSIYHAPKRSRAVGEGITGVQSLLKLGPVRTLVGLLWKPGGRPTRRQPIALASFTSELLRRRPLCRLSDRAKRTPYRTMVASTFGLCECGLMGAAAYDWGRGAQSVHLGGARQRRRIARRLRHRPAWQRTSSGRCASEASNLKRLGGFWCDWAAPTATSRRLDDALSCDAPPRRELGSLGERGCPGGGPGTQLYRATQWQPRGRS